MRIGCRLLTILLVLGSLAPSSARAQEAPKGHLFIVGGGSRPPGLMKRFVELAGGPGARIVVVPMASSTPKETGRAQARELRGLGAEASPLVLTHDQASDPATARRLDGAGGIWFSGGDQLRLAAVLVGTPTLEAIERLYRDGAVVGGTSAGAAVMSDPMITGSQIRAGDDTVGYYGDTFERIARGYIDLEPGFGLLRGAFVDQHFIVRERHNRLLSAVLDHPERIGIGIDESTVLEVDPDGMWRIRGQSAAVVYDARHAEITPPDAPVLGAAGLRVQILPAGSTYDPASGRATLPASGG
ncbi:MAG TPA: cyanophycinase [Gemmatimonadota bacterium]|nr:cyanophycinase [Gemmatimonadota bacterium]